MRHKVIITSLPQAYDIIKEMNLDSDQTDSDYRSAGRRSLEAILEERMQERISYYLIKEAKWGAVTYQENFMDPILQNGSTIPANPITYPIVDIPVDHNSCHHR